MQFILVLQWSAASESDYEALLAMEDALEADLDAAHGFVDGHDFGSGEMNIFVQTDLPFAAFQDAQASLSIDQRWADVRAAFRSTDSDLYTVVWPETLLEFSVS